MEATILAAKQRDITLATIEGFDATLGNALRLERFRAQLTVETSTETPANGAALPRLRLVNEH